MSEWPETVWVITALPPERPELAVTLTLSTTDDELVGAVEDALTLAGFVFRRIGDVPL